MSRMFWAKMPCWWQGHTGMHAEFHSMPVGEACAALKLYIAMCLRANFHANDDFPEAGTVKRSLDDLCSLTGVSRPMAIAGIKRLSTLGLITVSPGRPAQYRLARYEDCPNWTKLPSSYLYATPMRKKIDRLRELSNRSRATVHALQMYLYVASIRERFKMTAKVTYETLSEVLGIDRSKVTRAISVLAAHSLIGVRTGEVDEFTSGTRPSNVYWLWGSIKDAPDASKNAA